MSHQQQDSVSQPSLCSAGCGFYSNGIHGLCSKCFREKQSEEERTKKALDLMATPAPAPAPPHPVVSPAAASPAPAPTPTPAEAAPSTSAPSAAAVASEQVPCASSAPAPPKPSPTRCLTCNKKVGLTGFNCRCNPDAVFCSQHRYAEAHSCSFDYRTVQRAQLAEKNPVVAGQKLQKF